MPKFAKSNEEIIGEKYNKLTAIAFDHEELDSKGRKLRFFKFRCDCGNEKVINYNAVKFGHTTSCGRCGYKIDLKDQKFGRLTVIEFDHNGEKDNVAYWKCRCDCGNEVVIKGLFLLTGHKTSCGCIEQEKLSTKTQDDPESYKKLQVHYKCMIKRCTDPKVVYYERYGGRGITVEWNNFEEFYSDVLSRYQVAKERYGDDLEIDRINCNKNYSKDNVRFVPRTVNNVNKSNTKYYEYDNQWWTTRMVCNYLNIKLGLTEEEKFKTYDIQNRLRDGWSIDMIMEVPNRQWDKEDYNYNLAVVNPTYDVEYIKNMHKISQGIHPDDYDYLYNDSTENVSNYSAEELIEINKRKNPELFPYLKKLGKESNK